VLDHASFVRSHGVTDEAVRRSCSCQQLVTTVLHI
jgi:hypothetical protein